MSEISSFCTTLCRDGFAAVSAPKCCDSRSCTTFLCVLCREQCLSCDETSIDSDAEITIADVISLPAGFATFSYRKETCTDNDGHLTPTVVAYNFLYFRCSEKCDRLISSGLKRIMNNAHDCDGETGAVTSRLCELCCNMPAIQRWQRASFDIVEKKIRSDHLFVCGKSCVYTDCMRLVTKQQLYCLCCNRCTFDYWLLTKGEITRTVCGECVDTSRVCRHCGATILQAVPCAACKTTNYCSVDCLESNQSNHRDYCGVLSIGGTTKQKLARHGEQMLEVYRCHRMRQVISMAAVRHVTATLNGDDTREATSDDTKHADIQGSKPMCCSQDDVD